MAYSWQPQLLKDTLLNFVCISSLLVISWLIISACKEIYLLWHEHFAAGIYTALMCGTLQEYMRASTYKYNCVFIYVIIISLCTSTYISVYIPISQCTHSYISVSIHPISVYTFIYINIYIYISNIIFSLFTRQCRVGFEPYGGSAQPDRSHRS